MEKGQEKRRRIMLGAADALVEKVAAAAANASSASELKQLTGALKDLKDIQGLREEQQTARIRVELEQVERFAE